MPFCRPIIEEKSWNDFLRAAEPRSDVGLSVSVAKALEAATASNSLGGDGRSYNPILNTQYPLSNTLYEYPIVLNTQYPTPLTRVPKILNIHTIPNIAVHTCLATCPVASCRNPSRDAGTMPAQGDTLHDGSSSCTRLAKRLRATRLKS